MADVLLINPAYNRVVYSRAKIKAGVPVNPLLNLALLAAPVLRAGYVVKIIDLNLSDNDGKELGCAIAEEKPRICGITFTTPLSGEAARLAAIVKDACAETQVVAGGAHATSLPEEVLKDANFDVAAIGEADFLLLDLLRQPLEKVPGILRREGGKVVCNPARERIQDLDSLPYPAWRLYDLASYRKISLSNKRSPPGYLETSRGCPYACIYCNKNIQGRKFRPKSAKRVVDEIEYMLSCGFREINILDDTFSTDIERAKLICEEVLRRGLKFPWHPLNGMRVDCLDRELLCLMRRSGCYKVSFGIESGNQQVLDKISKGITLEQARQAMEWARQLGFETFGYFMLALPGETEATIRETVAFAKKLKFDTVKFNITVPLPGTRLFEEWEKQRRLKTKEWQRYNFYSPHEYIYEHPNLSHATIRRLYRWAYMSFYFSPSFLLRRLYKGIRTKNIFRDIRFFLSTDWLA